MNNEFTLIKDSIDMLKKICVSLLAFLTVLSFTSCEDLFGEEEEKEDVSELEVEISIECINVEKDKYYIDYDYYSHQFLCSGNIGGIDEDVKVYVKSRKYTDTFESCYVTSTKNSTTSFSFTFTSGSHKGYSPNYGRETFDVTIYKKPKNSSSYSQQIFTSSLVVNH